MSTKFYEHENPILYIESIIATIEDEKKLYPICEDILPDLSTTKSRKKEGMPE